VIDPPDPYDLGDPGLISSRSQDVTCQRETPLRLLFDLTGGSRLFFSYYPQRTT